MTAETLYTDGGVIGPNPSPLGGTWAFCLVADGEIVRRGSGVIEPDDLGLAWITNNATELFAALRAIASVPVDWRGTLWTDSKVTLCRLTRAAAVLKGMPPCLMPWLLDARRNATLTRRIKVELLAGHPTRADLRAGNAKRNGLPVSEWNAWCDRECTRLAREFRAAKSLDEKP